MQLANLSYCLKIIFIDILYLNRHERPRFNNANNATKIENHVKITATVVICYKQQILHCLSSLRFVNTQYNSKYISTVFLIFDVWRLLCLNKYVFWYLI